MRLEAVCSAQEPHCFWTVFLNRYILARVSRVHIRTLRYVKFTGTMESSLIFGRFEKQKTYQDGGDDERAIRQGVGDVHALSLRHLRDVKTSGRAPLPHLREIKKTNKHVFGRSSRNTWLKKDKSEEPELILDVSNCPANPERF